MGDLENGLLEWSQNLDSWKRDLLRRLAAGEEMSSNDLRVYANAAEYKELEKDAPWFSDLESSNLPEFMPLDATHLAATVQGGDPVQIVKVLHIHGANDLAEGAALDFNPAGLTIIAGRNGSGKSGYTRILKQVAASRASEKVLPNAFGPAEIPKAVVSYRLGSSTAQDLTWEAGVERVESPLQRVRVFDTQSASVHLAGSTTIAYVPSTLRVLADYTQVLQQIDRVIDSDIQKLDLQHREWPALNVGVGAEIFEHIGKDKGLSVLTDIAPLTAEDEEELRTIPAQLRDLSVSNPAALAVQARQRATQLTTIALNLEVIAAKVSVEAIAASEKLQTEVAAAQDKATKARSLVEAEDSISGTGGEAWQEMWNAAKTFIESNHEHSFPDTSSSADCPLCQQRLDDAARDRFVKFAEYMSGEAQVALTTARTLRNTDVAALEALALDSAINQDVVDLVSVYDEGVSTTLLPAIAEAARIRDYLTAGDEDEPKGYDATSLASTFATAIEALRGAASAESTNANKLAAMDTSAAAATQLQARSEALTVRKGLVAERDAIGVAHDRAIRRTRLLKSKGACNTASTSRKNSELSSSYVENVCQRFGEEAKQLGIDRVPVELIFDRSSRGVSYIKVSLKSARQVSAADVLSEGEQRITAIAGFFADLTESGDFSTLVFDDPVSSLDHEFRVKVAQRLLQEAERRQVLIFTHDFSFVQYLYEEKKLRDLQAAADGEVPAPDINYVHIDRSSNGTGVLTTAEEWRHVSIRERLGRIKQRIQNAGVLYRSNDVVAYGAVAHDIVGAIRDTWEAFVEQELLNNVVTRHDRRVQTQRLATLTDLTDSDVAAVDLGMSVESRFMTGHTSPVSDGSPAAPPDDLNTEVRRLENFRKKILERRR